MGGEGVTGERLVDVAERRIVDTYGVTPRRDVAAMDALHQYAFYAAVAMSGPWFLAHRVPWIGRDGLAHDGASDTLTVAPSHLLCLPDDPVVPLPGVPMAAPAYRKAEYARARGGAGQRVVPSRSRAHTMNRDKQLIDECGERRTVRIFRPTS
ncbi:hypothetical protein [Streptomyces sp. UNOC14_S4]|uniref:hypothetical protein n=1 Tax=Streptomyces sp. UNOC14_S4 TaxID=2872340 RepID=UPI001E5EC27F|nr:hypothetical protein [Streptomyces sp. UNOC14_S4]MCC3770768.1 hypothetical protein [Streptomyces sp. UNOC14_S4]